MIEETTEEIWEKVDIYIKKKFFVTDIMRKGPATIKAFFDGVDGETFEYSRYIYKSKLNQIAKEAGYHIIKPKIYRYSNRMVKAINLILEDCDETHEPVIFDSDNLDIPKEVEKTV